MRMQGGIQTFGEKYGLDPQHISRLQLCCEETVYVLLENCYPGRDDVEVDLSVSHAEQDQTTQIDIICGGAPCNPFAQEKYSINVKILKSLSARLDYRRTNDRNEITIQL